MTLRDLRARSSPATSSTTASSGRSSSSRPLRLADLRRHVVRRAGRRAHRHRRAGQAARAARGARRRHGRAALCIVYALIVFVGGWQLRAKMYEVGILVAGPADRSSGCRASSCRSASRCWRCASARRSIGSGAARRATSLADEAEEALKLNEGGGGAAGEVAMTTAALFVAAVRVHAARHADRGRARPVVAADDPLLRAGLARLAGAQALRDLGAVHAAGDPVLHPRRHLHDDRRRRQADDPLRQSPASATCAAAWRWRRCSPACCSRRSRARRRRRWSRSARSSSPAW